MEQFRWCLEFCDKISKKKFEMRQELFKFSHEFNEKYDKSIPYHIFLMNLVLAGMKETAHSRFLWKILSYEAGGIYPILESFCHKLLGFNLMIKKPNITREEGNIDILIQDEEYILIIENKRHDAQDQPNQLARYINFVKEKVPEKNIYICYLPKSGKEPSENSWEKPEKSSGSYKDEFKNRFKIVSFTNELSDWLGSLSIEGEKKHFLQTAIEQYAYLIKRNI
jgi:hypothetical protein